MPLHDTDFLLRWQHPMVRDLGWLLVSPDLLALAWPGRPTRQSLGLGSRQALCRYLDQQAQFPERLEERLGAPGSARLGHYHERLWQHLLDTAPGTRLLAHNVPILRQRRTLGELDLVYRYRHGNTTPVHLEMAIKFYLGLPEGPGDERGQARWIGTDGVDSLALKRQHLERHQFAMAEMAESQIALEQALGSHYRGRITQRLAMPGVLFYPFGQPLPAPKGAHPLHERGCWVHWRDWPELASELDPASEGRLLGKPHWLAPQQHPPRQSLKSIADELARHFSSNGAPRQLALYRPARGWQRVFVVEDDWPRRIPLGPR